MFSVGTKNWDSKSGRTAVKVSCNGKRHRRLKTTSEISHLASTCCMPSMKRTDLSSSRHSNPTLYPVFLYSSWQNEFQEQPQRSSLRAALLKLLTYKL